MRLTFIYPHYLWFVLLIPFTLALGLVGRHALDRNRTLGMLVLRLIIMLAIIFSLAGAQLRRHTDFLTTVFVLDASDSIPQAEQDRGENFVRTAIESMPSGYRAAIVVFGMDALVERLPSEPDWLPELASVPISTRTDIAGALQLGLALFPGEGARRLVLLSDGQENLRHALQQAEIAAAQGIEMRYVPLGGPESDVEAWITSLEAPAQVRQGQEFTISVLVYSSITQQAELALYADDNLLETRSVRLSSGENRYQILMDASVSEQHSGTGFRRFRMELLPENDTLLQNNLAGAFTVVYGPPSILLIEGSPGEGKALQTALEAADMQVITLPPQSLPTTLAELAGYDALLLVDVPISSLPLSAQENLPIYVRELGMGLLMVGGPNSFGAGGYLRTPIEDILPVDMDVRDKQFQSNLALVLAVDKSGSMGRCHCDNPDLNQSYTRSESGQPKVDIAKEAIMRAASALGKDDLLGVVAFDSTASWAQPLRQLVNPLDLEAAIGSFQAEGQTNLVAGVEAAYQALRGVEARRKHIILMTDGWVHTGDLTTLASNMEAQGITLSVIAAGNGSAEYLQSLAQIGGGRYYPATDILSVPEFFLKETVTSVGEYLVEEPFYPLPAVPGPALRSIDLTALPPLLGYNGTTAKKTARLDLLTPRGDPLLATWQHGLGRTAVWTSDMKAQWATEWLSWQDFPRFSAQLVNWLLPAPSAEGLDGQVSLEEGQLVISLSAIGSDGLPLDFLHTDATMVDPELETEHLPLDQVGPGRYEVRRAVEQPGIYLVRVGANLQDRSLGQLTMGIVAPYSPEYTSTGINRTLLAELAHITGGGELIDPLAAFLHNLPSIDSAREIWQALLLLAVLLFPLDVAVRRLRIDRQMLATAHQWLIERVPGNARASETPSTPLIQSLFSARERARNRHRSEPSSPESPSNVVLSNQEKIDEHELPHSGEKPIRSQTLHPSSQSDEGKIETTSRETDEGDTLARLRDAKNRARGKSRS